MDQVLFINYIPTTASLLIRTYSINSQTRGLYVSTNRTSSASAASSANTSLRQVANPRSVLYMKQLQPKKSGNKDKSLNLATKMENDNEIKNVNQVEILPVPIEEEEAEEDYDDEMAADEGEDQDRVHEEGESEDGFDEEEEEWDDGRVELVEYNSDDSDFDSDDPDKEKSPYFEDGTKRNDSEWMFFDVAKIYVEAGSGGDGCVAWRREKGVARGGPAGGNGGNGGSIYLVADQAKNTLGSIGGGSTIHFRAESGDRGMPKGCHGEGGRDMYLKVPAGTLLRDPETGRLLADLVNDGETYCIARGGRGGRGNLAFKTDRNRAPTIAEKGEKGFLGWIRLELKLLADVGLVGVPNAGKSTLLSRVTNAQPKIADYPFTTVVPNLGVARIAKSTKSKNIIRAGDDEDAYSLIIADIPGLLEGAHDGVGLGDAFLRHIERCRCLIHLIDGTSEDPVYDFRAINLELELFSPSMLKKPQIVLLNKMDKSEVRERWEKTDLREKLLAEMNHRRLAPVSALTGEGLGEVMIKVAKITEQMKQEMQPLEEAERLKAQVEIENAERELEQKRKEFLVEQLPNSEWGHDGIQRWKISGHGIERVAEMTNWDIVEAVDRFQRVLKALGITAALKAKGAKDGDFVIIKDMELEYFGEDNVYSRMAYADGFTDGFEGKFGPKTSTLAG